MVRTSNSEKTDPVQEQVTNLTKEEKRRLTVTTDRSRANRLRDLATEQIEATNLTEGWKLDRLALGLAFQPCESKSLVNIFN